MSILIKSSKWGLSRICFAAAVLVTLVAARPTAAEPASFAILHQHATPIDQPDFYTDYSADGTIVSSNRYLVDSNGAPLINSNGSQAYLAYVWNADDGMVYLDPGLDVNLRSIAESISPDGSVVVGSAMSFGRFFWTATNGFVAVDFLPAGGYAISDTGDVVGYCDTTLGYAACVRLDDGTVVDLGDLQGGWYESQAFDVSNDGRILVGYGYAEGYTEMGVRRAVLWDATNNYNISVLDMSAISGQWWGMGTSRAWAVSGDGTTVVGDVAVPGADWRQVPFRWTEAGGAELLSEDPSDAGVWARATAVSNDGSIVTGARVVSTTPPPWETDTYAPFVWSEATGMLDFQEVLTYFGLDSADWVLDIRDPINVHRTLGGITFVGMAKRSTVPGQRADVSAIYRVHIPFLPFLPLLNELACTASWDYSTGVGVPGLSVQPPWEDIDTTLSEWVSDLAVFDDGSGPELYAGGKFLYAGGNNIGGGIAKWDGQNWSSLGLGLRGVAEPSASIVKVLDDGTGPALYVVGDFLLAGSVLADRMAKWDGQTWSVMGTGVDLGLTTVYDLEVFDDGTGAAIYAAVRLDEGGVVKWTGSQWLPVGSGFQASGPYNYGVSDLVVFDDGTGPALYAAGQFGTVDGQPASGIAKWDGQNWSEVGGGVTTIITPGEGPALLVWDDGSGTALYGLRMYDAGGDPNVYEVVKWDGQSWTGLTTYSYDSSGDVSGFVGGFPSSAGGRMAVVDDGNGPALVVTSDFGTAKWMGGQEWTLFPFLSSDPVPASYGFPIVMVDFDDGAGNGVYFGGRFYGVGATFSRNIAMLRSCTVTLRGDCDSDGDIDMLDLEAFSNCLSGPGAWMGAGCDCADVTGNGVVDLRDFQAFMKAFTG